MNVVVVISRRKKLTGNGIHFGFNVECQTFFKSSYLRNRTLGSSLCLHQSRTWSHHGFKPTGIQQKNDVEMRYNISFQKSLPAIVSRLIQLSRKWSISGLLHKAR